jgi:hypothetical protein
MSFERELQAEMDLANSSASQAVRKARMVGLNALLDRADAVGASGKINGDASLSMEMRDAAKRFEHRKQMDKNKAGRDAIRLAEEDIARNTPPIPPAESVSAVSIDAELRAEFKKAPDLSKASDVMKMAIARAPAELTGLVPSEHADLQDQIRRKMYPEKMSHLENDRRVVEAAKAALDTHKETTMSSFGLAIEKGAMKVTKA